MKFFFHSELRVPFTLLGLLCLVAISLPVTLFADVYTWTDEEGVKHYSNETPMENKENIKVTRELKYNKSTDEQNWTAQEQEWEDLIRTIEAEEAARKQALKAKKKTKKLKKTEKEIRQEMIEKEQKRLENIIASLEAAPLSQFGSAKNKRMRLSVYKYKLEDLISAPEKYFGWKD